MSNMLVGLGCALWIVAPIALVAVLSLRSAQIELTPSSPVWVAVEPNSGQLSQPVDVQLEWQQLPPVVAPAWSGLVQSVGVLPGEVLVSGHPIARIDGVTRLAWASAQPYYRPLGVGDTGSDVADLNSMLGQLGLTTGTDDVFSRATRAGVRELAVSIGVVDGQWVEAFEPGWIVYLPATDIEVTATDLIVGAPAPAAGTTIAELDDRLGGATLVESGSIPDAQDEVQLPSSRPVTAQPGQTVTVGGEQIELADDRNRVADAALPVLRELVADEAVSATGRLTRPAAAGEWVVPAAAVFAGSDELSCVVTDPARPHGIVVEVVGSEAGRAVVSGGLEAGDRVLVRPEAELRRCG